MANRHKLHISKLEDFKDWLIKDGWEIEEPQGFYEVLRARKPERKNPLIVYKKADAREHLSLMDRDSGVVGAFLRDCKKPRKQTNTDRIRSMSDEELAHLMAEKIECTECPFNGNEEKCGNIGCSELFFEWLQSEVEE